MSRMPGTMPSDALLDSQGAPLCICFLARGRRLSMSDMQYLCNHHPEHLGYWATDLRFVSRDANAIKLTEINPLKAQTILPLKGVVRSEQHPAFMIIRAYGNQRGHLLPRITSISGGGELYFYALGIYYTFYGYMFFENDFTYALCMLVSLVLVMLSPIFRDILSAQFLEWIPPLLVPIPHIDDKHVCIAGSPGVHVLCDCIFPGSDAHDRTCVSYLAAQRSHTWSPTHSILYL